MPMQKEESPFIKIYDWMHNLNLTGKELLVYALIFGFREGWVWFGSKKRIAERLRMDLPNVSRALKSLKQLDLIEEIPWEGGGTTLEAKGEETGHFIIIYDWMHSLHLPGRELLVYALIFSFCRAGKDCYGRRQWIERKLHISNVGKVISSLKKKGLITEIPKSEDSSILVVVRKGSL